MGISMVNECVKKIEEMSNLTTKHPRILEHKHLIDIGHKGSAPGW